MSSRQTSGMQSVPRARNNALSNPRRIPAYRSVSLRHQVKPNSNPRSSPQDTSDSSSNLLTQQHSSGETSNADHWFENSNHNVAKNGAFADNDPPFFLDNNMNDSPPNRGLPQNTLLPDRSNLRAKTSTGSSSEEYRSVIDDLTIENKKLKRRLQRYEKLYDAHLDNEKLFEVKICGLTPRKKRELEETLRRFASTLSDSPDSGATAVSSSAPRLQVGATDKTTSLSSTKFADSGYGSMTTPGRASTAHSGQATALVGAEISLARNKNIHSYLHATSEALLPRPTPAMTEKSKKKLVVQRLEQLFRGRGASPGIHQHPLQQQEVSNSAAMAERLALEAEGGMAHTEGVREATIMETETEDPMVPTTMQIDGPTDAERNQATALDTGTDFVAGKSAPEQRPTRPLDLDPDRAQVPADNIQYMQHLGFLNSTEVGYSDGEGDSGDWIYVNLLIGLAQLHTINVTTDFVRSAVSEYSRRFELSADGRKLRWRSDASDSNSTSLVAGQNGSSPEDQVLTKKRQRPSEFELAPSGHSPRKVARTPGGNENKAAYNPLFLHQQERDVDSDGSIMDDESEPSSPMRGDVTGISSAFASMAKPSAPHAHADDGPIIFYNKATFCTDLSGDIQPMRQNDQTVYNAVTMHPLGLAFEPKRTFRPTDGFLRALSRPPSSESVQDSKLLDLNFPSSQSSPKHVTFAEPEEPLEFEFTGIGGITPSDNLAITVLRQFRTSSSPQVTQPKIVRKDIPSRMSSLLKSSLSPHKVEERIISDRIKHLQPSSLPPAGLHINPLDNEDEDDEDDEYDDTDSDLDGFGTSASAPYASTDRSFLPTLVAPAVSISSTSPVVSADTHVSAQSEPSDASDDNDNDDQSVDLLASARAINPDEIRAREREYDAELAERLAEEIPAGSSAATAGGGSGYNTPEATEIIAAARRAAKINMKGEDYTEEQEDEDNQVERSISS